MHFRKTILFCIIVSLIISGCSLKKSKGTIKEHNYQKELSANMLKKSPVKTLKILYIMSYHSPWEWTDTQFQGFKDGLENLEDTKIEYKVFQMDAKNNSSDEWKETMGKAARDLIDTWKPDLVFTSDDEAQEYVTKHYLNSDIPFVFSGVNKDPADYDIINSKNITGVLETEHFVGSVKLFKKILPNAKKIAVIFDDSPIWEPVRNRMKSDAEQFPNIEFIFLDPVSTYSQYKSIIKEYESKVDGIGLVGIFNFKDGNGDNVHYSDVLKWTEQNSNIPDFSFWIDRVYHGTLSSVSVSGYEQGFAAGEMAKEILSGEKNPSDFLIVPTTKGQPAINLARARKLGITIDSQTLLTSRVITKYIWED